MRANICSFGLIIIKANIEPIRPIDRVINMRCLFSIVAAEDKNKKSADIFSRYIVSSGYS